MMAFILCLQTFNSLIRDLTSSPLLANFFCAFFDKSFCGESFVGDAMWLLVGMAERRNLKYVRIRAASELTRSNMREKARCKADADAVVESSMGQHTAWCGGQGGERK